MSKQYKIRLRESDIAEAKRSIKNFNAKITRAIKKDPANAGLYPEKIKYKDFINEIETRNDFKKALKSFNRFTERGAEKIISVNDETATTKWNAENIKRETRSHNISVARSSNKSIPKISAKSIFEKATPETIKNINVKQEVFKQTVKSDRGATASLSDIEKFYKMQERINKERAERREKLLNENVKRGGVDTGFKRGEMGRLKENELKPLNKKFENMSQKEWENAFKYYDSMLDKQNRVEINERMRENYIKGLKDANIISDNNSDLEKYIRGVDFDTFYETHETDETATFLFYKDPIEFEARKDEIIASWKEAYESYQNK